MTVPQTQTLTVDREDLIVSVSKPADPAPIILTPGGSASLSVSLQAAYKTRATVTVQIFASDQTPVRTLTYPSAAFPDPVIAGGSASSTPMPLTWDGTKDDGTPADPGVYLYRVSVSAPNGDGDIDKSPYLIDSAPAIQIADDGVNAVCTISYATARPDGSAKAASVGQIDLYDPTSANLGTSALSSLHEMNPANNPNLLAPGPHTVTISIPSPQYGASDFLLSVQDNDALTDKGGRKRYALQVGEDPPVPCEDALIHDGDKDLGKAFAAAMKASPFAYHAVPHCDWYTYEPSVFNIRYPLQWPYIDTSYMQPPFPAVPTSKGIGVKSLRVLLVGGHGSDDGAVLCLAGPPNGTLIKGKQTLLVTSSSYIQRDPLSLGLANQNCLVMDTIVAAPGHIPPNGKTLDNLDLVVLMGCSQADNNSNSGEETLGQKFLELGARCVIVVGDHHQGKNALTGFLLGNYVNGKPTGTQWDTPGFLALLKKETVNQAYNDAKAAMDTYAQIHHDTGASSYGFTAEFKANILPDANAGQYSLPLKY